MEYDKINNLLLSENTESEQLSKFVTREYVYLLENIVYLILITKINQLDLKHLC